MLQQQIKEHIETTAAEVFELLSLCADRAFIDARECLKQFPSPLIDMPEGDVALERMDNSLYKVNTLFRVRHGGVEHFALPHFAFFTVVYLYLVDVLLNSLQLLRCNCQPRLIDRASNVVDQPRVLGRFRYFEVNKVLGLFGVHGLEENWEDGIVLELIFYPTMRDEQIHITIIRVPREHELDTIQHEMDYLLPYGVMKAYEADPQTRDLHNEFVGILYLFFLDLRAQLQLLYVVLEDKTEIEMPYDRFLFISKRDCLGV